MKKKAYLLILFILPILLALTAIILNSARGPYWLSNNLDPEYVYLLNASNIANFQGVGHIDHPGTPVQTLGAATIRVTHWLSFSNPNDCKTDVLKRPEFYLKTINGVMVFLNGLMLLIIGLITVHFTHNLFFALWLQAAPFFSITLLQFGLTRMSPEPLLLLAGSMMTAIIILLTQPQFTHHPKKFKFLLLAAALVTAFGIACKITFIPLIAVPLIALPKIKNKLLLFIAVVLGFVGFTLPIIRMYPLFFKWIYNLLTHSGHYGGGPSKLVAANVYLGNIQGLLRHNLFFTTILILSFLTLAAPLLLPRLRAVSRGNPFIKLLAGVFTAQVIGLLMVAKHSANHYLLPVLSLSGVAAYLVFQYFKTLLKEQPNGQQGTLFATPDVSRKILIYAPILFILIMAIFINPVGRITGTAHKLTSQKAKSMALRQYLQTRFKEYGKIFYYASSSPQYALKFGNDLSRSYHSRILDRLYPNVYFYDIWNQQYSRFDFNRPVTLKQIRKKHHRKLIVQGDKKVQLKGLKLKAVFNSGTHERIFRIEN